VFEGVNALETKIKRSSTREGERGRCLKDVGVVKRDILASCTETWYSVICHFDGKRESEAIKLSGALISLGKFQNVKEGGLEKEDNTI
jgi:hypothetical protein